MSLLSKIISNITFKYNVAEIREGIAPMETRNTYIETNFLLQVMRGSYWEGRDFIPMAEGSYYFIPKGHCMFFRMCKSDRYDTFNWDGYGSEAAREKYSRRVSPLEDLSRKKQLHTILSFDALLYDSIPFFSLLDLPAIAIPPDPHLAYLLNELVLEEAQNHSGKEAMLDSLTQQTLVRICRYLESQKEFAGSMDRLKYLSDRRLIDIITYIKENLEKDLSNKSLAAVSFLSEDYIGQFFKSLTGQTLQDYVEKQRLEKARQLLLTSPDSIQAIAFKTGFRDPAYFSRRFKLQYHKNANEFRKF